MEEGEAGSVELFFSSELLVLLDALEVTIRDAGRAAPTPNTAKHKTQDFRSYEHDDAMDVQSFNKSVPQKHFVDLCVKCKY